MTFPRALRSELLRFARSPLAIAHLACALAGGLACGAYFAAAPWDPSLGADATVQFFGAVMPLAAGIACGLSVDDERRAGGMANLAGAPSRRIAIAAKHAALWLAGLASLALALALFAGILAAAGRLSLGAGALALAAAGVAFGSAPLYALMLALALRFGRNAAIGVGAAGFGLALFSMGGLAHGLMTGQLTAAASTGVLGLQPLAWPARLGSLAVEGAIAHASASAEAVACVASGAKAAALLCAVAQAAGGAALLAWFSTFEERRGDA